MTDKPQDFRLYSFEGQMILSYDQKLAIDGYFNCFEDAIKAGVRISKYRKAQYIIVDYTTTHNIVAVIKEGSVTYV